MKTYVYDNVRFTYDDVMDLEDVKALAKFYTERYRDISEGSFLFNAANSSIQISLKFKTNGLEPLNCTMSLAELVSTRFGLDEYFETVRKAEIKTPDNVDRHAAICDELNALYTRKNHDYGDSFHNTFLEEGWSMPRIRLTDKLNRFKTLSKIDEVFVDDESIRDTLIDLANYAIMSVMELDAMKGGSK